MRNVKWMLALAAVLAFGLFVVGCGDDDSSTSDSGTATEESSDGGTADAGSTGSTPDDVLQACEDAIAGTPAEAGGEQACQGAADAFEQCASQADSLSGSAADTAVKACQDTADKAVDLLQAAQAGQ